MRIIKSLTDDFIYNRIISEDEREIVQYGLEHMIGTLSGFLITLGIGFCYGSPIAGLFLWLFLYPLRCNAGGYHADTRGKCILISIFMLFVVFSGIFCSNWPEVVHMVLCFVCAVTIWFIAPVGSRNKPLDEMEHLVYRRRTRCILTAETVLALCAWFCNWTNIFLAVEMALAVVTFSLVAGKRKLDKQ